jgi:hypothetical protein
VGVDEGNFNRGTISKTSDGGLTWTPGLSGTPSLYSIYFADANTGYAVGDYGTIIKTCDAGQTWDSLYSGTHNLLYSVCFADVNTGYAVGSYGTILKTTNGGTTFITETKLPESTFSIFPNPATTNITISTNGNLAGETIVSVFNVNGELVKYNSAKNQNLIDMNVAMLTRGIYLVKIQTGKGVESKKLVIQ